MENSKQSYIIFLLFHITIFSAIYSIFQFHNLAPGTLTAHFHSHKPTPGSLSAQHIPSSYISLNHAVSNDEAHLVGNPVILPSSFTGSPRAAAQQYQDAMAVVRVNGKPDAFVTFTCNPKWTEITENLRHGELPWMRPDLLNRVFKMKLDSLLKDLRESKDVPGYLGEVVAYLHVIEFQKRGLPHAHIQWVPSDSKY